MGLDDAGFHEKNCLNWILKQISFSPLRTPYPTVGKNQGAQYLNEMNL